MLNVFLRNLLLMKGSACQTSRRVLIFQFCLWLYFWHIGKNPHSYFKECILQMQFLKRQNIYFPARKQIYLFRTLDDERSEYLNQSKTADTLIAFDFTNAEFLHFSNILKINWKKIMSYCSFWNNTNCTFKFIFEGIFEIQRLISICSLFLTAIFFG